MSLSPGSFSGYPHVIIFALVSNLIVLLKVFTNLEVIRNFPADFTHWLIASWTIHDLSIQKSSKFYNAPICGAPHQPIVEHHRAELGFDVRKTC